MMRQTAFAIALTLACTFPLAAQEKKLPAKPAEKTISLSGCVVRNDKTPDQFTLEDASEGKYRLSGIKLQDFVGKRVQVGGAVIGSKRLVVKGGLLPNPNVAAQAGAMDPARAAVAASGGSAGPGTVELPEFKVRSVRPVTGGCPD
jgi:uncharacterized protein DUF5818